jgi:hypothetical protein
LRSQCAGEKEKRPCAPLPNADARKCDKSTDHDHLDGSDKPMASPISGIDPITECVAHRSDEPAFGAGIH